MTDQPKSQRQHNKEKYGFISGKGLSDECESAHNSPEVNRSQEISPQVDGSELSTNQPEISSNQEPVREWAIKRLDKFIEKWCGDSAPHLLDSDNNDGEQLRDIIRDELAAAHARGREERESEIAYFVLPKVEKFILKVESGLARSKETYADMKTIRDFLTPTQPEKEGTR